MGLSPSKDWEGRGAVEFPRLPQPKMSALQALTPLAPLLILIYVSLLLPRETAVVFSGVTIPPYRVVIAIFVVPSLLKFFSGTTRFTFADGLIFFASVWTIVSFVSLYDPTEGFVRGASIVVDTLGAYVITRATIRNYNDVRLLLIAIAPGFFFIGLILAIESTSHKIIYREIFASIFGSSQRYEDGEAMGNLKFMSETRLGLRRSFSSFSHPILAGVTMISLIPLYLMSGLRLWPLWVGLAAGFSGIFSVSSIAFLMLGTLIGMIAVDRIKPYIRLINWPLICAIAAMVLLGLHLVSEGGVVKALIRYTFDPHNGYVRIIQWDAVMAALKQSPWIGIGYARPPLPDWLPSSIDSHFLILSVRHGWLTSLSTYAAIVGTVAYLGLNISKFPQSERNLIVGMTFCLALWLLASFTVMFFAETNIFFMVFVGVSACMAAMPRYRPVVRRV